MQIAAGGTMSTGNMTWTVKPDAFFTGLSRLKEMIKAGALVGPAVPHATNDLAITVVKENPKRLAGLADFCHASVRLAMPNIQFEGVARQIQESLVKAGGEALKQAVYDAKVTDGSAQLTQIHHRQTPLYTMQGKADAGVPCRSKVISQEQAGHAISMVDITLSQNTTAVYVGALVKDGAHPAAARDWLACITSAEALNIFKCVGLKTYAEPEHPR